MGSVNLMLNIPLMSLMENLKIKREDKTFWATSDTVQNNAFIIYTYGKSSNHVFVRQGIFCKSKKIRGINTYKYSSGYKAGNHKEAIKREPWFYKVGVFLANSMKEQSMNQNAYHVADSNWIGKFTFPRNFSSVDFVIKPGNNGFSNFK